MDLSLLELELELLSLETEEKSPFERLTDEIFVKIFSYLEIQDLSRIRTTCWRFRTVCLENSILLKKKKIWLNLETGKDHQGEDTLEICKIYSPYAVRFLCTSTEVQVLDKTGAIYYTMPSSLQAGFQFMLDFFLRRCDIEHLTMVRSKHLKKQENFQIDEVRQLSSEEMNWILKTFEFTKATCNAITRHRMVIDSRYLGLIKQTSANEVYFEKTRSSNEAQALDAKYLYKIPCLEISSHLPVPLSQILALIKQWKRGTRIVKDLFFHIAEEQFTWLYFYAQFPIMFKPETDPLKFITKVTDRLQIGREINEEQLEIIYELDSFTKRGTLSFKVAQKARVWCDM